MRDDDRPQITNAGFFESFDSLAHLVRNGGPADTTGAARAAAVSPPVRTAERELAHMGETAGCSDHDHDLVHELSRRLDALWRYDQYIANAEWRGDLRQFWCDAKAMEKQAIQRLKELIAQEVRNECF